MSDGSEETERWIEALRVWNSKQPGVWTIPAKGTSEYNDVREIMGEPAVRERPYVRSARTERKKEKRKEFLEACRESRGPAPVAERKLKPAAAETIEYRRKEIERLKQDIADMEEGRVKPRRGYPGVERLRERLKNMEEKLEEDLANEENYKGGPRKRMPKKPLAMTKPKPRKPTAEQIKLMYEKFQKEQEEKERRKQYMGHMVRIPSPEDYRRG